MINSLNKSKKARDLQWLYSAETPLWDSYYQREQNKKFRNKWERIKKHMKRKAQ